MCSKSKTEVRSPDIGAEFFQKIPIAKAPLASARTRCNSVEVTLILK